MRVPSSLTLPEMQRAFRELQSLVLEGKEKSLSGGARNAHSSLAGIALPVGESDTTKLQAELEELRRILSDGILTEKEKAELRLRWAQAKTDFVYDVGSDRASGLAQLTGVNAAAYIATYDILDSISYLWEESGESRIDGAALDLYPAWKAFLNAKADFSSLAAAAVATLSNDLKARMDLAENDNALTETEKPLYRLTWAQIVEEYPTLNLGSMRINVHEEQSALVLTYAALDAVKAAWMDAGTTDITALNPKPSALFGSYFTAKQALADRINGGIKQDLDLALDPAVVADGVRTQYLLRSNVKRTNMIKRSKDYSHASWTKYGAGAATVPVVTANAGLASDGTMTADRIVFNRGGSTSGDICTVSQNVTGQTIGSPYAPSIELKSNTGANQQVMIYWGGLATGKGGGTITNVVTVTPEWQRFYCADLAAASTITIQFGTGVTFGDQVLDILVGHSQVETGTEPTPAIPTLDAAVSDYGLTGEDWRGKFAFSPVPRENIVRYSQDFTQPSWAKRGTCTATGNNIPGPDGNPGSGDTIAGLGAIYTNDLYQICAGVTGARYEPSFWIYKISTSGTLRLQNSNGGAGQWNIDLALLPDGWSKIARGHAALTVTQEFVCAGASIGPHFVAAAGGPLSFGIWQIQMEQGFIATPEIITYNGAATRTDYTVASGVATFAVAPYQGTILRGLSSNADAVAAGAAAVIAAASLDTKITNLERPALRNLRASLAASVTAAKAKAAAMVPVVPQTALDTAWTTFTENVDPILAASTDTTIVKATFDGWWSAVYSAVTDLQGAMTRQAEATANLAYASALAAGSDGILSRGEKPGIIIDYQGATSDHTLLVAKALSCGVRYDDFSAAFGALRDYLDGLSPAYNSTTTDTPINAASWAAVWGAWGSAYTSMLVRIASAAPSTVDGITTADVNITTNAAAPVVDGIARDAGKVVMLAGQTVKAQNGVYGVVYTPPTGTAYNVLPATATPSGAGGGATGQPANAYDVISGDTPNDVTYATLVAGDEEGSYGEVVFSGFSGTNLTGDLTIKITPDCETGSGGLGGAYPTIRVQTSTDSGVTWSVGTSFRITTTMQTIAVPVSAATGSALRVKVRAQSAVAMDFDENHEYVAVRILGCTAKIHSVYLAIPAQGVANWSLVKQASIPNASVWRTRAGTTRPQGSHYLATVATDGGVTLTTQEAPYEAPLGKPGSGSALLKRDSGGATSWEARRYGFPDYAAGATRALATVYQAATDGWLSLVLVGSYINDVVVYVGSTNNPTNQVFRAGDDINANTKYASGLIPIPAGTYYKVANGTYGFETTTLKWYPALT